MPHRPSVVVAGDGGRPPAGQHIGEAREAGEEAARHWQLRPARCMCGAGRTD